MPCRTGGVCAIKFASPLRPACDPDLPPTASSTLPPTATPTERPSATPEPPTPTATASSSSPEPRDRNRFAPRAEDLADFYAAIAGSIPCASAPSWGGRP